MAQSLKARFEQLAEDQTRDPNIEITEHVERIEHRTEKPVPGMACLWFCNIMIEMFESL